LLKSTILMQEWYKPFYKMKIIKSSDVLKKAPRAQPWLPCLDITLQILRSYNHTVI